MRILHELKYLHFTTFPNTNDHSKMAYLKAFSEFIWSSPFHQCYGLQKNMGYVYNKELFDNMRPFKLAIQAIVFGILGITSYFKPKIGMTLAAATLCPKLYHRFEENSPTQYVPFSSDKVTQLTTVGYASKGGIHPDGQMVLTDRWLNLRLSPATVSDIKEKGVARTLLHTAYLKNVQFVALTRSRYGYDEIHFNNLEGMKVVLGLIKKGKYILNECSDSGSTFQSNLQYIFCIPKSWSDEEIINHHKNPAGYNGSTPVGFMEVFRPPRKRVSQGPSWALF